VLKAELVKPTAEAEAAAAVHWRRSVSRPDLAGALIDFVRVGILFCIFCERSEAYID
jgi:hypothetical protein